jgi:NAD(P)-dependent dehydrogenase (short-subunit alcohol dehydrogenase family)
MTEQKVALITGAGSGIGKSTALTFLRDGFRVVLAGREQHKLEAVAVSGGGVSLVVVADVTQPDDVRGMFDANIAKFGRLDVLFNNAGVGTPFGVNLEDLSLEQWRRVIDTNLTGAFLCTQHAFRIMKTQTPRGGRIINNGSISAHVPRANSAPYTASKHGITGLTKSSSLDGRKYDIAVGQIDIGNALTDMARSMTTGMPQANGEMAVEAVMDVQRVAESVVYMASLPPEANALFLTVMATKMPFVGRG